LTTFKEINKTEIAEGQQTFDDNISQIKEQWKWFSQHQTKFKDVRDKRLAHLDNFGDKYQRTEVESLG
jgi:hypothetical protein